MKKSIKDKVEGKAHELKGAAKETIGNVVNNPDLKTKGQAEKIAGKVQQKVGDAEKAVGQ
jgi:uncharacterized protein YjbJ (UPF0337 family)